MDDDYVICEDCGDDTDYCSCADNPVRKAIKKIYPKESVEVGSSYYEEGTNVHIGQNKSINFSVEEIPGCCGVDVIHHMEIEGMLSKKAGEVFNIMVKYVLKNRDTKIAQYYTTNSQLKINNVLKAAGWEKLKSGKNPKHDSTINIWYKTF